MLVKESSAAGVLREGSRSGAALSSLSCLVTFSASGLRFERKEVGGGVAALPITGLREGAQTRPGPPAPAQLGELALIEQCLRDIYWPAIPWTPHISLASKCGVPIVSLRWASRLGLFRIRKQGVGLRGRCLLPQKGSAGSRHSL